MIIEKTAAKKNLTATLAFVLGVALPAVGSGQMISGRVAPVSAVGAAAAPSVSPVRVEFMAPALGLPGFLAAPSALLPAAPAAAPALSAAAPLAAPSSMENAAGVSDFERALTATPGVSVLTPSGEFLTPGSPGTHARTSAIGSARAMALGEAGSSAALDANFEGSAVRPEAALTPAHFTVENTLESLRGGVPLSELAKTAESYISTLDLPESRDFLGAQAIMDNGWVKQWRFSYSAHRGRADRFTNKRTKVEIVLTPGGAFVTKSAVVEKNGFFASRKVEGLEASGTELKTVLAAAAEEYPDMIVETARFTEELDSAEFSLGTWDPPEASVWSVPVWRLEGRSKDAPGVRIKASYAAKTGLLRDERTKIEGSTDHGSILVGNTPVWENLLPANTPVWANVWVSFKAPYPTAQRVVDAKRDRIVRTYGVQRWTELKTEPKMYGYKVYRMRMTAVQFMKLRHADTGAHYEYAETGGR